jgi:hypothetical protein
MPVAYSVRSVTTDAASSSLKHSVPQVSDNAATSQHAFGRFGMLLSAEHLCWVGIV